jgi:hypothetical protein
MTGLKMIGGLKVERLYPVLIILAALGLPALLSFCFAAKENPYFEATVEDATDVLFATYLGCETAEDCLIHEFRVERVFKGETGEDIIRVYCGQEWTKYMYGKNKKYYLALKRCVDVLFSHDRYFEIYSARVRPDNEAAFVELIEKSLKNAEETYPLRGWTIETRPYYGADYIRSDDFAEIVAGSEHIFLARAERKLGAYEHWEDCRYEVWEFAVLDTLKGSAEDSKFNISLFEGTAEAGKEYMLLVFRSNGVYSLSSKNSLQPPERREEIERLLGEDR